MKGITPIISTIILLVIAIALAGTAYLYLSGFIGPMTAKDFVIVAGSETCTVGSSVSMRILNTGTTALSNSDIITSTVDGANVAVGTFTVNPGANTAITLSPCAGCTSGVHVVKVGTVASVKSASVSC